MGDLLGIFFEDLNHAADGVRNSVLWADVAHPVMIGVHGYHQREGDILENLLFDNIDILEHHEPQDGYWGCMAINVGDKNTVRNVTFRNIRVEQFEMGRLIDIRVFHNKKYNPTPANGWKTSASRMSRSPEPAKIRPSLRVMTRLELLMG
ncbi:hypothetical protein [Paenibacillus sp. V4I7]|uniref:hypothetical protein n=1 Tax=Paenibacillus sp. V4I7 TaxID=3042307 RepID=UPI00278A564B|nr:hypothetical protein [Paenibacillus sp. V4I7]MDQ0901141.1 hypothetical protein [Paenibacillus sp. V4I7]